MGNLTTAERGILITVNTGASSLSLVVSAFIVLCYLLFKELPKFSFKLVFFLALSLVIHFITLYAPLWDAILFNGITYFQVIHLKENEAALLPDTMAIPSYFFVEAPINWGYDTLILIESWFLGAINRMHDFIEPGHKISGFPFLMLLWLHLWACSTQ